MKHRIELDTDGWPIFTGEHFWLYKAMMVEKLKEKKLWDVVSQGESKVAREECAENLRKLIDPLWDDIRLFRPDPAMITVFEITTGALERAQLEIIQSDNIALNKKYYETAEGAREMGRSNLKIREKVKQREDNAYERVLKSVKSDIKSILGGTSNSKETWEAICLQHENSARTDSELMVEFYNIKMEPGMTIDQYIDDLAMINEQRI